MSIIVNYNVPYSPQIEPSFTRFKFLLDRVDFCGDSFENGAWIGDSINNGYNCKRCLSDPVYFMPFVRGDVFPLQTFFPDSVNADVTTPSIGFKTSSTPVAGTDYYVEMVVLDSDCVTQLGSNVEDYCDSYWVGYSSEVGSIQTIFFDTSNIPLTTMVFRLKFNFYDTAGNLVGEIYSEPFMEVGCDEKTILFNTTHPNSDCLNHQYKEPANYNALGLNPKAYTTSFRYNAELYLNGVTQEREQNDNEVTLTNKIKFNFRVEFVKIVPPYVVRLLTAQITGETILIDNEEYVDFSDIDKNLDVTRNFLPSINCFKICIIQNFDCN